MEVDIFLVCHVVVFYTQANKHSKFRTKDRVLRCRNTAANSRIVPFLKSFLVYRFMQRTTEGNCVKQKKDQEG